MNKLQLKIDALQNAVSRAKSLKDKVILADILLELKKEQLYGKKSGN